ncbi:MAG: Ig-like domain-containing protein [Eubacterium sp.]|nr:Ig-like domain-containing protein [Eubacterium sp.]
MKNTTLRRRILSLMLALLMAVTGVVPAASAFAEGDGVEGMYQIELFYKDSNTIVPTYVDDTVPDEEKKEYIEYMIEGQKLNLTYQLIDTEMPNNARIYWYSENPTLADVDQNGVVKAFDSSKGAVIQLWIDNEVKTIPVVGSKAGELLEKVFYSNDYVDIDSLDTEEIINIAETVLGDDSLIGTNIEGYKADLLHSLEEYLDKINVNIHVQLIASDGTVLDDDMMQVCVQKNTEWYANFLPNGTHITNKSQIDTTVAKGSTVQLYAVTTPLRLHYKCVYSIKSSSIFDQGKVVATVNDSGLVSFKNTGTVTVVVSPDTEEIIENILKLINYAYALDNTGTIDSDKIAGIIIDYVGLDINRTVLAGIIDAGIVIKDATQDAVDPVQLSATAIEIISNLVLQFVYNDEITFTVVEAQPLTDFNLSSAETVKEGAQMKIEVTDIQPSAGDINDITWTSSNPAIASVDENGIVTGRDAGGSLGQLSKSDPVTITAVSAANQIERTITIYVTGKTGRYLSDIEITGPNYLELNEEADYTYQVYPQRVAQADNLYVEWGLVTGTDDNGDTVYTWATADEPAQNEFASIDSLGHYKVLAGGVVKIAVHAYTGYQLSNGNFYEISNFISEYEVFNGIPVESINISVTGGTSNGDVNRNNTITINDTDYQYVTIKKGVMEAYWGNGANLSATVYPENATNQNLKWVVDNGYYTAEASNDTHTVSIKQQAGHENADTFNVYAVSADGRIVSNVITVCVTKKYVTTNTINEDSISVVRGKTADATHTVGFESSAVITGTTNCCYKCNWYSSDESIFTVETKTNDNRDATITAVDVGTATLYCVSADGGVVDTCQVTVYPDKERLQNIVDLCDKTVIVRNTENAAAYKQYMHKLDLAYTILYDEDFASQITCDTYADELLYAFYRLGGFVGILGVDIKGVSGSDLASKFVSIDVGTTANYKNQSYDFDFKLFPSNAMYSSIEWTSSNSGISVDKNGKCSPTSNDPAAAAITCTVTDYMGNQMSDTVYIAFSKTPATDITLDKQYITGGEIGKTETITPTVLPTGTVGVGAASNTGVIWSSSDESIATVDANGVVTFVAGGKCVITATTMDGGHSATCQVKVVTNYSDLELLIRQYTDLNLNEINYYPDTWAAYKEALEEAQLIVSVRDSSQAEVNKAYAKLQNAYESLKKYNDIQKIELYLDGEETKEFYQYDLRILKEGISYKNALLDLNARIYPNNGSYAKAEWFSSTDDISVTTDGKCSPTVNKSCYGRITCIVTDHFGREFEDSVWVSFSYNPVTGVDISESSITGEIGSTYQLSCTIQPTGTSLFHIAAADIQDHYWESDDESVATVDETGLVSFVNAGSTIVRCVSYDGGIDGGNYAECEVSSEGNRTELRKALAEYADVDYTEYEYSYGMSFKAAYEAAQQALSEKALSQEGIDSATATLVAAAKEMIKHPYVKVDSVKLTYQTYKKTITGSTSYVSGSTVDEERNAVTVNLSSGNYSNWNSYNYITLTAAANPSNSMYDSITFSVKEKSGADVSVNGNLVTVTPTDHDNGAYARIVATVTDKYGRETAREVFVTLSDSVCTGIDVSESSLNVYAGSSAQKLNYTVSGSPEFNGVVWSSSDESVVTVNENGYFTPIEKGSAVITAKTVDGGYSDTVTINVATDFRQLAAKQNEYATLIDSVNDDYEYTQESLDALAAVVAEAKVMVDEETATQAEVNTMLARLTSAYNSLVKYALSTGVEITADTSEDAVEMINDGFVRFTGTLLNGQYISLTSNVIPAHSIYTSITWESSNSNISVDEDGLVMNNSARAGASKITCTVTNEKGESYSDSIYVSFTRYGVTSVSFEDEMVFGAPSQTKTVTPVIKNSNDSVLATYTVKDCIFESDNPEVATVDDDGVVNFISQGTANITAISLDGGIRGSITAYTTWDTTALKAAIDEAEEIEPTDYAVEYATALTEALETAKAVYADVYSSQQTIDDACEALTLAINELEGNEFIVPEITISHNDSQIGDNYLFDLPDNESAQLTVSYGEGAMLKSSEIVISDENGASASVEGDTVTISRSAEEGSLTITVNAVDNWDREYTQSFNIKVLSAFIYATDFNIVAEGYDLSGGNIIKSCGGTYTNFSGIQLGYELIPADANAVESVSYSSSADTYITVSEDGLIELTTAGRIRASNTANITVTVTNADGSEISKSVSVTITRR